MKKLFALALSMLLVLGLFAGCGAADTTDDSDTTTTAAGDETGTTAAPEGDAAAYGPQTKAFVELINGGAYHMGTKAAGDVSTDIYSKDGMIATVSEVMGVKTRIVVRDEKMYTIMDATKTIVEKSTPKPTLPAAEGGEAIAESAKFYEAGKADFDGRQLDYEQYQLPLDSGSVYYFIENGKLVGTRTETGEGSKQDLTITVLDSEIPAEVFEIPTAGYTVTRA